MPRIEECEELKSSSNAHVGASSLSNNGTVLRILSAIFDIGTAKANSKNTESIDN